MTKCKHCNEQVKSMPHHCRTTGKTYNHDDSSFLDSLIIGIVIDELLSGLGSSDSEKSDSSSDSSIDFGDGDFGGGGSGGDW